MPSFSIPDMSSGHCKATVEQTIHALDPAAEIEFDMTARRMSVKSSAEAAHVRAALVKAGYPATPA